MQSTIRLFRAVPIEKGIPLKLGGKKLIHMLGMETYWNKIKKEILQKTIQHGFILSLEVIYNYSESELDHIISQAVEAVGLNGQQMNSSFHKSWSKIQNAEVCQLVLEQVIHYLSTYGAERLGVYDQEAVYIPTERLEIPNLEIEDLRLIVIKGYTKKKLREKLLQLLGSGVALKEETIRDVIDVATYLDITESEIAAIKNKEVRVRLYDYLDSFPENPLEFLRFLLYKSINKTLLIKNKETIAEIKSKDNLIILTLLRNYSAYYGITRLAEIFYRFKPIWLAFRTNTKLKQKINRIRRLARKYHKPMGNDYLNTITARLNRGESIDPVKLRYELDRANTFRKIRLAYALNFRMNDPKSIVYKIRNGKGYATDFNFRMDHIVKWKGFAVTFFLKMDRMLQTLLDYILVSIVGDLATHIKGKRIYIPKDMVYALPATEKQFTGNFPSGSSISIPQDLIVGIHWENTDNYRVDLDLSMVNASSKLGWDGLYRNEDRRILFSGDMTDAPKPGGASELYYIKKRESPASKIDMRYAKDLPKSRLETYVLYVNYYNYDKDIPVPYSLFVAQEHPTNNSITMNYMVDPNNIQCLAKSKIDQKQKILGLLVITPKDTRFYFCEVNIGRSITSGASKQTLQSLEYLVKFYNNTISLNALLVQAGAIITHDKEDCDLDLSPESLEKDQILKLFYKKEEYNENLGQDY